MEYLNLATHLFRSPGFIGADPAERGTWIALMGWCASQENGGRIAGCRGWKDRMWQQLVGVTADEVLSESTLWDWDGDDLLVAYYPFEQERALHAKRDGNARGGRATTEAKSDAARANGALGGRPRKAGHENPSQTQAEPNGKEGKEMEQKGREGESTGARPAPIAFSPSLSSLFDRVRIQLETVFPHATKALSPREREALHSNAEVLGELSDDDWLASRCWVMCPDRIRDRTLWPRNRLEFIESSGQALEQIRPWWKGPGGKWWKARQSSLKPALPTSPVEPNEEPGAALRLWKSLSQEVA